VSATAADANASHSTAATTTPTSGTRRPGRALTRGHERPSLRWARRADNGAGASVRRSGNAAHPPSRPPGTAAISPKNHPVGDAPCHPSDATAAPTAPTVAEAARDEPGARGQVDAGR
jgi:hypothetical protein